MITAGTRLACLLGHPVAHSVSPAIHNAAFAAAGVDAVYLAFDVAPVDFAAALAGLRAMHLLGANVTVPHKRTAFDLAERRTPEAHAVGAVNTLFVEHGVLVGDNTDAAGLQAVLERDIGLEPGDGAVVFGAGGAARAAAVALARLGARVQVVARRAEAAREIEQIVRAQGGDVAALAHPRLVVNATPLGLHGEALPERFARLDSDQVALDLVYGAHDTPFLAAARARGAHAVDGLGMLVAQAALAFERWTGVRAPVDTMQEAAARALRRA